jgi:hypothetical protein
MAFNAVVSHAVRPEQLHHEPGRHLAERVGALNDKQSAV